MSFRDRTKIESTPIPEFEKPPVKQVIMYHANDEDPNRLYTLARLEDETIDRIARRVVEMLNTDVLHPEKVDTLPERKKGKRK
jgi:hypothetical protein